MEIETPDANEQLWSVVLNDEEQYSIWFADRPTPLGWREEGTRGSRQECLDHIERIWVDMRPKSLRDWLARREEPKET